jgi:hypothetical protein
MEKAIKMNGLHDRGTMTALVTHALGSQEGWSEAAGIGHEMGEKHQGRRLPPTALSSALHQG